MLLDGHGVSKLFDEERLKALSDPKLSKTEKDQAVESYVLSQTGSDLDQRKELQQ